MKVGILGSGQVAQTLGAGFLAHGHEVTLGTRDASKLEEWSARRIRGGRVGSFSDAATFGDARRPGGQGHRRGGRRWRRPDPANLAGKPVHRHDEPDRRRAAGQRRAAASSPSLDDSLMERLQSDVPDARFVKAFSSRRQRPHGQPRLRRRPADDVHLRRTTRRPRRRSTEILDQFGWDVADMGAVEAARAIEPLCILWCIPGFLRNEWTHAFALLH